MDIRREADKIKRKTGAGYILRAGKYGTACAEFCGVDLPEYDEICTKALRMKNVEVECFLWNRVVRVWTVEDWKKLRENNEEAKRLTDGFWEALHNYGRAVADKYFKDHAADYARLGI